MAREMTEIFNESKIKGRGRYHLLMSKDDNLCRHMLDLFNDDLEKYGDTGDSHQIEHDEFRQIFWEAGNFSRVNGSNGKVEQEPIKGALFDFNNDGVNDLVVRWEPWLAGGISDYLFVLPRDMASSLNNLNFNRDMLADPDQIYLSGYAYPLSQLPGATVLSAIDLRVMEPFIYNKISYLLMRPLFEFYKNRNGIAVISKYHSGKFVDRDISGSMDDICYYTRIRVDHQ